MMGQKNNIRMLPVEILKPLVDEGFTMLACPGNHDFGYKGNVYTEKSQALFQGPYL